MKSPSRCKSPYDLGPVVCPCCGHLDKNHKYFPPYWWHMRRSCSTAQELQDQSVREGQKLHAESIKMHISNKIIGQG
jgi:hypothetical protein